ncbi:hypothetical protein [Arthrobacter sp. NPDC089319]|uniref:hypothetical protein n=1 Tax=Arthrobacter sp. NPDC089319 TaxID=3155915 RepID=UPI00344A99C8
MRGSGGITALMFGIILAIIGLQVSGHGDWAGFGIQGLMILAVATTVVRAVRGRKHKPVRPVADPGSEINDLYLGTVYRGPRIVAPPQAKHVELVIDDAERQQFLKALDDADPRSAPGRTHDGSL